MNYHKILNERGWVIIKNIFTNDEINQLREAALASADHQGDVLSNDNINSAITKPAFIDKVKHCLNCDRLVYFGDSTVSIDVEASGFHKDSRDRKVKSREFTDRDYSLVRVGIYLQDHSQHPGGLIIRDKSHLNRSVHKGDIINVPSEKGDLVVWKLTTTHSSNASYLKYLPSIPFHPYISKVVPKILLEPPVRPRIAIFSTYGKNDDHLKRYIEYLKTREYFVDKVLNTTYSHEQIQAYKKLGVEVVRFDKEELKEIKEQGRLNVGFVQI